MSRTSFDRSSCLQLRADLEAHLASFEKEHGIKINLGNARFDTHHVRFLSVEVAIVAKDGAVQGRDWGNYQRYYSMFGLPADGLGKEFTYKGQHRTIIGLAMSGRKGKVMTHDIATGKTFSFDAAMFAKHWGTQLMPVEAEKPAKKVAVKKAAKPAKERSFESGDKVWAKTGDSFYRAELVRLLPSGKWRVKWKDDSFGTSGEIKSI